MNTKLYENWFKDLQKPEIDKYERAIMLREFLDNEKLSIRGFAKKYNFNKSTIEDWLLWEKINPKEFSNLKKLGYSDTEIYRTLRDNKKEEVKELFNKNNKFQVDLWKIYKKLTEYSVLLSENEMTNNTKKLLIDIKEVIEDLERRF